MALSQLRFAVNRLIDRSGIGADLQSVLQSAGLVMIVQAAAAGLNYGSQVLLARWMGVLEFGVYVFAWSWAIPLASAAAIGLTAASVRFVPQYSTRESWGHIRGLIRRSTWVVLGAGTVVAVVGVLTLSALDGWLAHYYIAPTQIALLCIPFLTFVLLLSAVAQGFGWVALAFVPQLLMIPTALLICTSAYVLFVKPPDAVSVAGFSLLSCGTIALVSFFWFRSRVPDTVRTAKPVYETTTWFRVAIPLFLADGIFLVLWNVDTVMIGSLMDPDSVAVYFASVKTAGLTCLVFTAVQAFAAPKFAAIFIDQDQSFQERFAQSIASWIFWTSVIVVLAVVVAGKFILSIFGEEYVAGYPVLIVLCVGHLIRAVAGPLSAYLSVSGHQDDVLIVNGSAAVSNVVCNAVLIPLFGIMGAALATVLAILTSQIALYILVRRRLGINALFLARA